MLLILSSPATSKVAGFVVGEAVEEVFIAYLKNDEKMKFEIE